MQPPVALRRNCTVHLTALRSALAVTCQALRAQDDIAPHVPLFERPVGLVHMAESVDGSNIYPQCPGQLWGDGIC